MYKDLVKKESLFEWANGKSYRKVFLGSKKWFWAIQCMRSWCPNEWRKLKSRPKSANRWKKSMRLLTWKSLAFRLDKRQTYETYAAASRTVSWIFYHFYDRMFGLNGHKKMVYECTVITQSKFRIIYAKIVDRPEAYFRGQWKSVGVARKNAKLRTHWMASDGKVSGSNGHFERKIQLLQKIRRHFWPRFLQR